MIFAISKHSFGRTKEVVIYTNKSLSDESTEITYCEIKPILQINIEHD